MKIILHVVINCILLIVIVMKLNDITEIYSEGALEMEAEVSELSKKIKSGEEVLSPLQYSEILDVVNDRGIYYFYLNISGVISLVFYVLSICMFYMGISVGKKSIQVKK